MTEINRSLAKLGDAIRLLIEIKTAQDVKQVMGLAEAARVYAQQAKLGLEAQNYATEIKLRAARMGGEILAKTELNIGRPPMRNGTSPGTVLPTLNDLGITKKQSSCWQRIAAMPETAFTAYISEIKEAAKELTTAGILQAAARLSIPEPTLTPPLPTGRYRCIVIDPPWPVAKIEREERPNQGVTLDYPTMTIEAITALPIPDLAEPTGCHVYLWATHKFIPAAFDMFEVWGVRYQCLLTWVKPTGMTPYSWMYNTEHVLFGRIGSLGLERMGLKLAFDAPVTRHSEKPAIFYQRTCEASPGPRLDMFARTAHIGFAAWGNEAQHEQ